MQRKLLALVLTVVIVLFTTATPAISVQAATSTTVRAEQVIGALGIMNTDNGSSNSLTTTVTRGQYAQMLINISSLKESVTAESNVSLFSDVSKNYWAAGYIQTAITQGLMSGYLNGTFKPSKGVTLAQAVGGVLKLLGYTKSDYSGSISSGQMALYATKGLNKNINKTKNQYLSRSDCMNLFYNILTTTTKEGKIYGVTLGYTVDTNGEIDYLSLVNVKMKGPIIVDNDWMSDIPFSLALATYCRNGSISSYSEIQDYDVIYYSDNLKTIWAYDSKVTGTIQTVTPNRLSPSAVTVAGKEYTLGSSAIATQFSTLGDVDQGDIVTLLLGKDNSVVAVLSIDEYNSTLTGVVLETGEHMSTDVDGNIIYCNYVVIVDAQGNEYQQDYNGLNLSFSEGNLARVTYEDSVATVNQYDLGSVTFGDNTFSSDGSTLGSYKLSSDVKILDLLEGKYCTVYQKRLAGLILGSSSVYYYELNKRGEISQLILSNVTGDLYDYGILSSISYQNNSDNINYEYIIDGVTSTVTAKWLADYNMDRGAKGFLFNEKNLLAVRSLTKVTVTSIGKTAVLSATTKYLLADKISVYYLKDGNYYSTVIDKVSNLKKYNLTAYYDGAMSTGGRVRVIVAENIN